MSPKTTTLASIIEEPLAAYTIEYRVHATRRMFERCILSEDIEHILASGQVIERYEDTPPFLHVLLNGKGSRGRPLHVSVVIEMLEKTMTVITVYEPNPNQWTRSFSRRQP